jgi:hypothetical protein
MIQFTETGLDVSVNGPCVYLDNWAFIELAEKQPDLRVRFLNAVRQGIDLLFSVTNAADLSGAKGRSAELVREFLDGIGLNWFPVRLDVTRVVMMERAGGNPVEACVDKEFFESHVSDQMHSSSPSPVSLISEALFRLGPIVDRVGCQRESIQTTSTEFDRVIKDKMSVIHSEYKRQRATFDRKFPIVQFHPRIRASFVYHNLLRAMAIDSGSLKRGDGLDFCHAVMACAFSSFAALDSYWQRRLSTLPKHPLARVYSRNGLDRMVSDMEKWLRWRDANVRPPLIRVPKLVLGLRTSGFRLG